MPVDSGKSTKMFMLTLIISLIITEVIAYFLGGGDAMFLIAAAVVSVIIAAITVSSAKASMVAHNKTEAQHYVVKDSFQLTGQNDRYVRTYEEKG